MILSLPSALEERYLTTLTVAYDGSYEDQQGILGCLVTSVLRTVQLMTEGQKVMITEGNTRQREGRFKEACIERRPERNCIW